MRFGVYVCVWEWIRCKWGWTQAGKKDSNTWSYNHFYTLCCFISNVYAADVWCVFCLICINYYVDFCWITIFEASSDECIDYFSLCVLSNAFFKKYEGLLVPGHDVINIVYSSDFSFCSVLHLTFWTVWCKHVLQGSDDVTADSTYCSATHPTVSSHLYLCPLPSFGEIKEIFH